MSAPRPLSGPFTPELLDACISCGFCLPACPTYALTGDETSSPRGRINLMRALEDGALPTDDPTVGEESSFCLGCRACEPVCPAGVQYGALLEEWRDALWRGRRRPLRLRLLLWAVSARWRVRLLGLARRHARRRAGSGEPRAHLMLGCFERALFPQVSRAAARLDERLAVTPAQGCCGALHAHNGELAEGRAMAERLGEELPGEIVTTSGGCAAHLASVLGPERVRELSQWLAGAPPSPVGRGLRIGVQDSCHLRNGLGVAAEPRALVERVGELVEIPGAGDCCGAAGTYATLRPEDSRRVLAPKLEAIAALDLDVVVAVNPGCLRQLRQGLRRTGSRTRAMHLAELLADPPVT